MATKLTCPACLSTFIPKTPRPGKPVRCPTCREVQPNSESDSAEGDERSTKATKNAGGIKCPGCKRVMPRGVTFCVACNISLFDAWGDAETNSASTGRRNEVRGYVGLAAKTTRIFIYFITLRWGKLLEELI